MSEAENRTLQKSPDVSTLVAAQRALNEVFCLTQERVKWTVYQSTLDLLDREIVRSPAANRTELALKAQLFREWLAGNAMPETPLQCAMSVAIANDILTLKALGEID